MQFFDFKQISAAGSCVEIAQLLYGVTVKNGRCAAAWRGGDNHEAVKIDKDTWFDHVQKEGGGIVQLSSFKFGGNIQLAQEFLGQHYRLTPKNKTVAAPRGPSRYDMLLKEGYEEKARYEYKDLDGRVRHVTVRLQHPEKTGKEFVQGAPDGKGGIHWGLKGVETVLYRLPEISGSEWVLICEGEKSALCLAALGIPSTTCAMGAGHWHDEYTKALAGKRVVLAPDNDFPGKEHAEKIAREIYRTAESVKIIPPQLPDVPKSGIDDVVTTKHLTRDDILLLVESAPLWKDSSIAFDDIGGTIEVSEEALAAAKQANSEPFRNYIPNEVDVVKRGKPAKEITKEARNVNDMSADIQRRFLGFPRKVGSQLFDHDKDTGEIVYLPNAASVICWIGRKSKKTIGWACGDHFGDKSEFFNSLLATARRYEGISHTPDWPRRKDVFYAHPPLPKPCPDHSRLKGFISMLSPASEDDAKMLAAFTAAPLWYKPGIPKPSWIIDSQDGAGSGKTILVELVARIYSSIPVRTNAEELKHNVQELLKRLLSSEGRTSRIVLIDNVTGDFRAPGLADLITAPFISGRAPYGHGEEKRPNNLVFVITANSAQVDHDLAARCYYVHLRKPGYDEGWLTKMHAYIDAHRLEIIADIIDIIENHKKFSTLSTRFPEFETCILQPMCGDAETYQGVIEHMKVTRAESDVEEEVAVAVREVFVSQMNALGLDEKTPIFLRSEVVNSWAGKPIRDIMDWKPKPIQQVRNLAKQKHIKEIDAAISQWPISSKKVRYRGLGWNFDYDTEIATIVHLNQDGSCRTTYE